MNTAVTSEISTLDSSKYGDTTSSEILQNSMEGLYRFNSKGQAKLAGVSVQGPKGVHFYLEKRR